MERHALDFNDDSYPRVAPDIAVEGFSQWHDTAEALDRVVMWLKVGTLLVWLVDAAGGTVLVRGRESMPRVLTGTDTLDGQDILPRFGLPVHEIFAP